jgi:rare lipoprotein A
VVSLPYSDELTPNARGEPRPRAGARHERRLLGVGSSAWFGVTSCAIAETPEKNASQYPGEPTGVIPGNPEMPTGKAPSGAARERGSPDYGSDWTTPLCPGFEPEADACRGGPHPCCGPLHAARGGQFGKAAWYDLVGYRTASGEILDTVTATATHRSLPLASYAKVTNLDNGRSVIVKINDRGPYTRGRIIDLSPRAADALDIKRAGVAAVAVESLVNQTARTASSKRP